MTEPIFRHTYDIPGRAHGVTYSDYYRVVTVNDHGSGQYVDLRRCGTGERRTIGLREFQRRARPSPDRPHGIIDKVRFTAGRARHHNRPQSAGQGAAA